MKNIMRMPYGTKIIHKRSGLTFTLGGHINEITRAIKCDQYIGQIDYINDNTQEDYEVVE